MGEGAPVFEDPVHRAMVLGCITEGALPLKFAYAGSGAHAHDDLARSAAYRDVVGSVRLESATLRGLEVPVSAIRQIAEVGPGNGQHTTAFLGELTTAGYTCERYLGLDFSQTLLKIAAVRLSRSLRDGPAISVDLWDIEQAATGKIEEWRTGENPVLVCVLGQTLGNVENPSAVLANLRQSLRPGDLLLLGLAPRLPGASPETYLAPYRSAVFRRAALEPLRAVGIDLRHIDFRLRYEDDTVIADAIIRARFNADGVTLEPGHVVRCFLSRRFNPEAVAALLRENGWLARRAELDGSADHFAVVAAGCDLGGVAS